MATTSTPKAAVIAGKAIFTDVSSEHSRALELARRTEGWRKRARRGTGHPLSRENQFRGEASSTSNIRSAPTSVTLLSPGCLAINP
jgi:hypothetical protein